MKKNIITAALILILSQVLFAQSGARSFVGDSLDQYVLNGMKQWEIPGVQVLIVKDGGVAYMKSFGVVEQGKPEKVDNNTLFMIGSNTKAFTGTAMALLEYRKQCSLQDPVKKYLPDFTMKDPWLAEHINLTDILTHRIGMITFQGDFIYWGSDLSRDECIEKFGLLSPGYEFRTRFGYTNAGYAIADKCIETIDGRSWADFIRQEIFLPLNMTNSFLHSSELKSQMNISAAHSRVNNEIIAVPRVHNDNIGASASIWSSVSEMKNWVQMQLDAGMFEGEQKLPREVIGRTRIPQTIVGAFPHQFNKRNFMLYGLGWFLEDYESKKIVSHTGGVDGFVSAVTLIPEEKLGIVILTNSDQNSLFGSLNREIVDAYLALPYRNYDSLMYARAAAQFQKEHDLVELRKDSVAAFTGPIREGIIGSYTNDVYGSVYLRQHENRSLMMTFEHHPLLECVLEPITGTRFLATYNSSTYGIRVFDFKESDGNLEFVLSVADFLEYTTYTFTKAK